MIAIFWNAKKNKIDRQNNNNFDSNKHALNSRQIDNYINFFLLLLKLKV